MLAGAIRAHQASLELTASSSCRLLMFKGEEDLRAYEHCFNEQNYGECDCFGCSSSEKWAKVCVSTWTRCLLMFIGIFVSLVLWWRVEHVVRSTQRWRWALFSLGMCFSAWHFTALPCPLLWNVALWKPLSDSVTGSGDSSVIVPASALLFQMLPGHLHPSLQEESSLCSALSAPNCLNYTRSHFLAGGCATFTALLKLLR